MRKIPPFNENDYDLDGVRRMVVEERLDDIQAHHLTGLFDEPRDGLCTALIAALRAGSDEAIGGVFIATVKQYITDGVTDEDVVEAARALHLCAVDREIDAEVHRRRDEFLKREGR